MGWYEKILYCCCYRDKDLQERNETRRQQEEEEAGESGEIIKVFNQEKREDYAIEERLLPAMGSRLQKYWFQGHCRYGNQVIVTQAPLSKLCPLRLDKATLDTINNDLLPSLSLHPFIQPVLEIYYHTKTSKLLSIHPICPKGSLRDIIYQDIPIRDWSKKYIRAGTPFSADKIAKYGKQILLAISFLYKQGFSPLLGHVHAGNIFISEDGERCKLGGYENTLLGYRTRLYRHCVENNYVDHMDVIMFGHVIYLMSSGVELGDIVPQEAHYQGMDERIKDILRFIFLPKSFKAIMKNVFFKSASLDVVECKVSSSPKVRKVLKDVSRGSKAQQPNTPYQTDDRAQTQNIVEDFLMDPSRFSVVEESEKFGLVEHLPDIGRRKKKYWSSIVQLSSNDGGREDESYSILFTTVKVPGGSGIDLNNKHTLSTVQQFLNEIEHAYLMKDMKIHYLKSYERVIVIESLIERGSLRDMIQGRNKPLADWSRKLQDKRHNSFSPAKIATYGRQILEAIWYLYQQGFPPLGHVHTGNIYFHVNRDGKEACLVGGYENTLLGYETTWRSEKYNEAIDIVMFGHVIFELGSGFELDQYLPSERHYEKVKESKCRELLADIFRIVQDMKEDESVTYKTGLERIMVHKFFDLSPSKQEGDASKDMKQVLAKLGRPPKLFRRGGALEGVMESVKAKFSRSGSGKGSEIEMAEMKTDKFSGSRSEEMEDMESNL